MEKPLFGGKDHRDGVVFTLGSLERFSRTRKTEVRVGVVKDRREKSPGSDIG